MKEILIFLLLIVLVLSAGSQELTVLDLETGYPLELAVIQSNDPEVQAITDFEGKARLDIFSAAGKIEISILGYKTLIKTYDELKNKNFIVRLSPLSFKYDEIVVYAPRKAQRPVNSASKITSVSPKDIYFQNPQTSADMLGMTGEVFIQKSQQGGGSPMIRGFSANRLLYVVDGVRMNNAIFRGGNIHNVISIDPLSIEKAEVFFGPGSVIYGSDAIGGVLSFQTITPGFSNTGKASLTGKASGRYFTANNGFGGHLDLRIGWEKWASSASISYSGFGDMKMGKNGPDDYLSTFYVENKDGQDFVMSNPDPLKQKPTGYSQLNLMQKIRFRPSKNWDFMHGFHYSKTSDFPRYDRLTEIDKTGIPRNAVWRYGPHIWMMNNFMINYTGKNLAWERITIRLAQQYFEESRIDRRFDHPRLRTQLEKVRAFTINTDLQKRYKKHVLFYGLEYVHNNVKSSASATDISNNSNIRVPDRYPASKWNSYAFYINYRYPLLHNLHIETGARYSAFNIASDFTKHLEFYPFDFTDSQIQNSSTTASIGLVYRPDETWKISISGNTGYRAPNVDDIGKIFDFSAENMIVPNTSLQAEYSYNAEAGISKIFSESIKIGINGFYTFLDNAMIRRPFKVNGQDSILYGGLMSRVYAIQNAARGMVYGYNAGIEAQLPAGFSTSFHYNYQLGYEETENGNFSRSRQAAPAFGIINFSFHRGKLTAQVNCHFSAGVSYENLNEEERQKPHLYAKDRDGNPYSPAWQTFNLKSTYRLNESVQINAGIENIMDKRYRPYSSGLSSAGRSFIFSLTAFL